MCDVNTFMHIFTSLRILLFHTDKWPSPTVGPDTGPIRRPTCKPDVVSSIWQCFPRMSKGEMCYISSWSMISSDASTFSRGVNLSRNSEFNFAVILQGCVQIWAVVNRNERQHTNKAKFQICKFVRGEEEGGKGRNEGRRGHPHI